MNNADELAGDFVSTHSRPKAAALVILTHQKINKSFNTQPPEGGCSLFSDETIESFEFQHTAARRRLRW